MLLKKGLSASLILGASLAWGAPFADVPATHWAAPALEALARAGVVVGHPDGTYRGAEPVTRYELAVSLYRFLLALPDALEGASPTEVQALARAVREARADLAKTDLKVEEVRARLSGELEALRRALDAVARTREAEVTAAVREVRERTARLEAALQAVQKEMRRLAGEVALQARAQETLRRLEWVWEALQTRVGLVEAEVQALEEALEARASETALLQVRDRVVALQERLLEIERAVLEERTQSQRALGALRTELAAVRGRTEALEARLDALRFAVELRAGHVLRVEEVGGPLELDRFAPGAFEAGDPRVQDSLPGSAVLLTVAAPLREGEARATFGLEAPAFTPRLEALEARGEGFSVAYARDQAFQVFPYFLSALEGAPTARAVLVAQGERGDWRAYGVAGQVGIPVFALRVARETPGFAFRAGGGAYGATHGAFVEGRLSPTQALEVRAAAAHLSPDDARLLAGAVRLEALPVRLEARYFDVPAAFADPARAGTFDLEAAPPSSGAGARGVEAEGAAALGWGTLRAYYRHAEAAADSSLGTQEARGVSFSFRLSSAVWAHAFYNEASQDRLEGDLVGVGRYDPVDPLQRYARAYGASLELPAWGRVVYARVGGRDHLGARVEQGVALGGSELRAGARYYRSVLPSGPWQGLKVAARLEAPRRGGALGYRVEYVEALQGAALALTERLGRAVLEYATGDVVFSVRYAVYAAAFPEAIAAANLRDPFDRDRDGVYYQPAQPFPWDWAQGALEEVQLGGVSVQAGGFTVSAARYWGARQGSVFSVAGSLEW